MNSGVNREHLYWYARGVIPPRRQHGPGVDHPSGTAQQVDTAELDGRRRRRARAQRHPVGDVDRVRLSLSPGVLALPRSGLRRGAV
jgi:hypothetical protein